MSDYLLYWKVYWDCVEPDLLHWTTDNEQLYAGVQEGDSCWVVTSGGPGHMNEWRLVSSCPETP